MSGVQGIQLSSMYRWQKNTAQKKAMEHHNTETMRVLATCILKTTEELKHQLSQAQEDGEAKYEPPSIPFMGIKDNKAPKPYQFFGALQHMLRPQYYQGWTADGRDGPRQGKSQ